MQIKTPFENAIRRKYPEQLAVAIARDARGVYNPITLGWIMRVANEPPMLAISVGKACHSLEAIRHSRNFVLSLPSAGMVDDVAYFGNVSGRDVDKLETRRTPLLKALFIDGVLLKDALANFECKLQRETDVGDHVLFIGGVVAAHQHASDQLTGLFSNEGGDVGACCRPL